jgi:hypothetical protein
MKYLRFGSLFVIAVFALTGIEGCSSAPKHDAVVISELDSMATEIHTELKRMNDVADLPSVKPSTKIKGCSARVVSLDFDGDIMLFIEEIRKSKICDIRVVGKKPQQDVILSLHHTKVPFWHVVEDASVQSGHLVSFAIGASAIVVQLNGGTQL